MNYLDRRNVVDGVDGLKMDLEYWQQRFSSQIEFAQGLCQLNPGKKSQFTKLIAKAHQAVQDAISSGNPSKLQQTVKQAEEIMAPIGKVAKKYTIRCAGHAHIDMNWMWSWPETVAITNDTFTTVLKLMDEFDDFCFSQSQASVYEIVRKYNPPMFEQIRKRVAEGRWEVVGANWVEGDKNLASAESLVRHAMYTRQLMSEVFDLKPEDVPVDWEPDTFGHAATIPTIFAGAGVKYYYACRGNQFDKPALFWWQSPDGSRILVDMDSAIDSWYNDLLGPKNITDALNFWKRTGKMKDWLCVYGVGDHGGGPTRRDLKFAQDMNTWPIYPNFKFSTTKAFFEEAEKLGDELPVVEGELNFEFTGCYTSQSAIKKTNRQCENDLVQAETAAVLAERICGREYPAGELREGWIKTLFGHFHDILPGSGVAATSQYHLGRAQETQASTGMIQTLSYREIAQQIDTSFAENRALLRQPKSPEAESRDYGAGVGRGSMEGGISHAGHAEESPRPMVMYNTLAWDRRGTSKVTIWDSGEWEKRKDLHWEQGDPETHSFVVRMPDGKLVPAQRIDSAFYWNHHYIELAVPVEVSALGYGAISIEPGQVTDYVGGVQCKTVDSMFRGHFEGGWAMSNEFIEVDFDVKTGGISKLVDKATGADLADPANPIGLEYVLERAGRMTSWLIHDSVEQYRPKTVVFEGVTAGPHLASQRVKMTVGNSEITVTYTLKAGQRWLDVDIDVMWREHGSEAVGVPSLRMNVPTSLNGEDTVGTYEIPFGTIQRASDGQQEVPSLRFADVSETGGTGCVVLNDCKYGHCLDGATMSVSLIRSSYEPDPMPEQGQHNIRMALAPHGKKLKNAEMIRMGAEFNHPLQVVNTDVHTGDLPARSPAGITCTPASVIVSSVSKALDSDELVVRLFETAGRKANAKVAISPELIGKVAKAVEVDVLQRPVADSTAKATAGGFTVSVPASGIATVKLALK